MLARYKIIRGKRPADEPLPEGIRQDTRKHTRHVLRPPAEIVSDYLAEPTLPAWEKFQAAYLLCLRQRYQADSTPFDQLAQLATDADVYLGCSCPTARNPSVDRCHTVLALRFMQECYPTLAVEFPHADEPDTAT